MDLSTKDRPQSQEGGVSAVGAATVPAAASAVTAADLIARARTLAAEVADRAVEIDSRSRLPDDLMDKLVASGLIATLTPKVHGGFEFGLDTASEIVRIFAAACPAVAWVLSFYIGHNWVHSQLPEACQKEIFANGPSPKGAGTFAPGYKLIPVEGGYRVSGRTGWNSGAPHADWFQSAGMVVGGEGPPGPRMFMTPRADVTIIDTWNVAGMRATGSWDMALNDVFVPEHRTMPMMPLMLGSAPGSKLHVNPLYSLPFLLVMFSYVLPTVVGAVRGACDDVVTATRTRASTNNGQSVAVKPGMQARIGRNAARTDLIETMLREVVASAMAPDAKQRFDVPARLAFRARAAVIIQYCRETLNDLVATAGANAFRNTSLLQMLFRDINMVSLHAFFEIDNATETYGRTLLGLEVEGPI